MKYYDISPLIEPKLAVFPGDRNFQRTVSMDFEQGHHLGLSSIETTVHLGAHADAPCHYGRGEVGIDQCKLETYFGWAQVIRIKGQPARIQPEHLGTTLPLAPRLLFATDSFPDPTHWNDDFSALSPELIRWAHQRGVILFGIDTPSVDPADSKALESHQALLETKSAVLEGIVLTGIPEGVYFLSALPLRIKDADASPVRAVLWDKMDFTSSAGTFPKP